MDSLIRRPSQVADEALWTQMRARMLQRYLELLAETSSPLLETSEAVGLQLQSQFLAVVDEAVDARVVDEAGVPLSSQIGHDRASTGIHPSQSLAAANLIFAAALHGVADRLRLEGVREPLEEAALRLNRVILRRMGVAAAGYVEHLLDKAATAHRDEARRLSRELHDAVGPNIAVGLQRLDLIDFYLESDPTKARELIHAGHAALNEALSLVRNLAARTRMIIEPTGLGAALRDHLDTLPTSVTSTVCCDVDLSVLSIHMANEVFLILREAIHNAATHASPAHIFVDLRASSTNLIGVVTDDGPGFDPADVKIGTGTSSMAERAALLDADFSIRSSPGGTTVTLDVPLPSQEQR